MTHTVSSTFVLQATARRTTVSPAASFAIILALIVLLGGAFGVSAQPANLVEGCIADFDPQTNYFPVESTVEHAAGFTIEYFDSYKIVTVTRPWQNAPQPFVYVLVQCGASPPADLPADAAVIEVPVRTVASLSATYLPHLIELGVLDRLIAVDEFDYIYNADVQARIADGDIIEIGSGSLLDVEQALDAAPDVTFAYGSGFPEYDAHPLLIEAGLGVALSGDFNELTALGRAEWLKFTAAFFNREAEANALFDEIATNYADLTALTADLHPAERPTVLLNAMFSGTWYISGGASYAASMVADAGGAYVFADDTSTGGVPLTFEAVIEAGAEADVWLNPNIWRTLADGLAEDERYAEFAAFQTGQVYNNNARSTELGSTDYFEYGGLRVDWLLADLIAILYPDLLPDHALYFYQQLQ